MESACSWPSAPACRLTRTAPCQDAAVVVIPLAAVPVAFLIAILFVTGQSLQVFYQIPGAMVQLIQAIVVMMVAAGGGTTHR